MVFFPIPGYAFLGAKYHQDIEIPEEIGKDKETRKLKALENTVGTVENTGRNYTVQQSSGFLTLSLQDLIILGFPNLMIS